MTFQTTQKLGSFSLCTLFLALAACSGSKSGGSVQLVAMDYSRVTTDDELRAQAQQNPQLQGFANDFYSVAQGRWTITNPEAYENVVAGSFNFKSPNEVETDLTANIPGAGPTRIIENSPYIVLREVPNANGLGRIETTVRKVSCDDMVKEGGVIYCTAASLEDVKVLRLDAHNLDLQDAESVWNLRR